MTILDWILGRDRERARQEAEAKVEMTRPAHQEADLEHVRWSGGKGFQAARTRQGAGKAAWRTTDAP